MEYPLLSYLETGISASQALELLKQHDCLTFPQLRSGLFPAANFDNLESDETGMANAWLRDTACIGLVLLRTGQTEVAGKAARGVLDRLRMVRPSFEAIIEAGQAPANDKQRPPVRFANQDSEPRYDWANAQNDALGYSLQFIGITAEAGALQLDAEDKAMLDLIVTYLGVVQYWADSESGHWEEVKKLNTSSIGTVVAGLRAVTDLVADANAATSLLKRGQVELAQLLPNESKTPGMEREHDSALVFLVEPQAVVIGNTAAKLITDAEQNLMGEHGFRRYNGDSYWGPDYREHFLVGDRAADFSDPKDMALRDQYLTPGGEAQWTFIDPMVAAYYARQFQATGSDEAAQKAQQFIARALSSIITHEKAGSGDKVWRLPELFFLEKGVWVPNDHLGLLWGQANLLYGLTVYQDVFGDALIKKS